MKAACPLLLLICAILEINALQAQDIDSTATKEKSLLGIKLPPKQRVTISAHYERVLGTNVESAGGAIGLIWGQPRKFVGGCFDTYQTYHVLENGVMIEWSLSEHAMAFNLGFVPTFGKTNCILGLSGYAIKASNLKTKNELQRTKKHDHYRGVKIEGTLFWVNPYLAAYTNFNDSFVAFGMGVRF
jgi:hypothetical protein